MSNILNLLSFDGFISVNKVLIRKLGLEEACVVGFLATMHEYHAHKDPDGWFYVKHDLSDQDEDVDKNHRNTAKYQLGLSSHKFLNITNKLEENGIIITERRGIPANKFYKFNEDIIFHLVMDEGAIKPVNKGTRSDSQKLRIKIPKNQESRPLKITKLYIKEKINKKESISLLENISPQDVTLDLIKKEAKRREKDIKSFIKDELGKKISGNEYKKLFENFCNNYWEWIQRKEIKSYTATFEKFISEENSYKSNEPVQQGFVSPKSKKPPAPLLSLGLPDTSTDFIKDSQEWQNLLKEKFDGDIYDKWIKCLIPHRKEGEKVIFSVETKFVRDWVIRQYQTKIQEFLGFDIVILSIEP